MASSHENKAVLFRSNPATRDADADLDIIAIHGLDTQSPGTWAYSKSPDADVNWLLDENMLAARVKGARIFTCNWPADLLQKPDTIATTLEESARHLLNSLTLHMAEGRRETPRRPIRPILFIASYLGGIILIKALQRDPKLDSDERDLTALRKATRGIVFLATPFRGTSFKEMPGFVLPLWAWLGGRTVSALINCTREPPSHLDELVHHFVELQRKHEIHAECFWEGKKTNLLRKVWLCWVFSPHLHIVWIVVLLTAVLLAAWQLLVLHTTSQLHHFTPWLLVVYSQWLSGARACEPKELVHKDSATLTGVRGQRLDRPHVLMNKFGGPECQDYSTVAKTIEEMAVRIREGSLLARADRMIKERYFESGKLKIKRLSGDPLAMKSCYINLAVVEKAGNGKSHEADDSVSLLLLNRQKVETPNEIPQVDLLKIFDAQQKKGAKQPRRILIQGRAGVGKTTLCKKMVHDFYTPETNLHCSWTRLFDRLLWVPLRNLKLGNTPDTPGYNLEKLCLHEFFSRPTSEPEFARELSESMTAVANRTLFLLDGLDEILHDLNSSGDMYAFVQELLNQPNIIITSRPSAAGLSKGVSPPDLELETVGFYPDQVDEYVRMAFTDTHKFEQVRNFLQQHWLIQGLVRIPIQLDALCYTWNDGLETVPDTMTSMYEMIELKLWKKDIVHRLKLKREDNEPLSEDDLQSVGREYVEKRVPEEMSLLEGLAFSGLINNIIDFQEKHVKMIAGQSSAAFLYSKTCRDVSFLRSSDFSLATSDQRYYFIHLTFQEYFAARYFVKQWKSKRKLVTIRFDNEPASNVFEVSVEDFVRDEKYNASYDIFWRFVAGLLGGNDDQICDFFCMVQNEPRDLLGLVHQQLVIHCLAEISLPKVPKFRKLYRQLECEAKQWLVLELRMTGNSRLAAGMEFPDKILAEAFKEFPEMETLLYGSLQGRPVVSLAVMDHIASCLGDAKKDRKGALRLLRDAPGSTPEKVIRAVVNLLKDDDEEVRSDAAAVLWNQSALPQDVIQAIVRLATGPDKNLRPPALTALRKQTTLSQDVLQSLVDSLKDVRGAKGDYDARFVAWTLRAQSALPRDVVKALASLLKDPAYYVRRRAVLALGTLTALRQDVDLVQALVNMLQDSDGDVCLSAVSTLGERSRLSKDVLEAFMKMLQSPDERVLLSNAEADKTKTSRKQVLDEVATVLLSRAAPSEDEVLEQVVHLLGNGPQITQQSIVGSLGHRDVSTPTAIQLMTLAKDHPNAALRMEAAWAMERRREFGTLPEELTLTLGHLLKDSDKSVRIPALCALVCQADPRHLGQQEELVKVAVDLLTDSEGSLVRHMVIKQTRSVKLAELVLDKVALAVADLLKDPDTDVRQEAVASLCFLSRRKQPLPKTVALVMASLLEDPDIDVWGCATEALADQSNLPEDVLLKLIRFLGDRAYYQGRRDILIGQTTLPKQVLRALASTLHDPMLARRHDAASILLRVELPLDILQAIANLIKSPEDTPIHGIAMNAFDLLAAFPESFCSNLAEMDDQCFTRLYRMWLERAFWYRSFFYEKNKVYHIHLFRGHQEIPVPQLRRAVQAARKALEIPEIKPLSIKDSYQCQD